MHVCRFFIRRSTDYGVLLLSLFVAWVLHLMRCLKNRKISDGQFKAAQKRWRLYFLRGFDSFREIWPIAFRYESPSLFRRAVCSGEFVASMPQKKAEEGGRILVVQPGHIGDIIQSVPPLRALRKKYPAAKIDLVAGDWNKTLTTRIPYVDHVIHWKTGMRQYARGNPAYSWTWREEVAALKVLRRTPYSQVYLMGSVTLMTWPIIFAVAAEKVRLFGRPEESKYTGVEAEYVLFDKNKHHMDRLFELLEIEPSQRDAAPESLLTVDERKQIPIQVQKFTANPSPRILVSAGAGWKGKRWPEEKFAELIRRLHDERKATIGFTGSENERELHSRIEEQAGVRCLNLAGKTDLIECMQLMRYYDLLITNDNGTLHLASVENVRTLALYGPTDPGQWGVRGRNHHIIKGNPCSSECIPWHPDATCTRNRECMNAISVDEVFDAACRMLLVKG